MSDVKGFLTGDRVFRRAAAFAGGALLAFALRPSRRTQAALPLGALAEAEERFRAAFDNAPIGMAITSLEGTFASANRALADMLGRSVEDLVGARVRDLTHPPDRDADTDAMRAMARGESATFQSEKRYVHTDGHLVWVALSVSVVRDLDGQPLYFVSQMEDVTDRRRTQVALVEAEERFRLAFDGAPVGIAMLELEGGIARVNPALCQVGGYREDELLGRNGASLTHPEDQAAAAASLQRLFADETRTDELEVRMLHASGQALWVSLSMSLVRDAGDLPVYVIAQVQDISERKRFESQLAYLADHDPLTGLYNRRAFQRELDRQTVLLERYGRAGAVLLIDLDNFKDINDTLGHAAGDELISRVAGRFRERVRRTDVLGRLGGDEFAVILRESDRDEAELVAHDLLAAVREQSVLVGGERRIRVSASIGIALFDSDTRLTGEELLVNADLAMYNAKEAGRDRVAASFSRLGVDHAHSMR